MSVMRRAAELAEEHLARLGDAARARDRRLRGRRRRARRAAARAGRGRRRGARAAGRRRRPGHVANPGPALLRVRDRRALPAALGADWLTSAWDQNAFSRVSSPAAAAVEAVAERWVLEALGLPGQCRGRLHDRRHDGQLHRASPPPATRVLARAGWDVEARRAGRRAADQDRSSASTSTPRCWWPSATLGLGAARAVRVPADDQRRDARRRARRGPGRRRGAGDRLRAGRRGQHRRLRPARRDRRRRAPSTARGCTSTAPSACGRRSRRTCATSWRAPSAPTRGRSTRTSGSTCPTTAGWRSWPTARRCAPPWASPRATCRAPTAASRSTHVPEMSRRARAMPVYAALRQLGRDGLVATRRAQLRAGAAGGGRAAGARRGRDPQRRRAQPGARALRRRRRGHPRRDRRGPAQRRGVAGRHGVGGPGRGARLGVELVDERGRHRPPVAAFAAARS